MSEDLSVIKIDTKDNNRILIEIGNRSKKITGAAKTIQEVVRLLLTTPGTDARNLTQGAGLQDVLRRVTSRGSIDAARIEIITRINNISEQIQQNQAGLELDPDERLVNIEVLSAKFVNNRWEIRARVKTEERAIVTDFGNILIPEGTDLFQVQ